MNVLTQILAGLTAVGLLVMGVLEITRHGDPRMHRLLLIAPEDVPAVRMWAMNIGAYNIAFALGIACGLWLVNSPRTARRRRRDRRVLLQRPVPARHLAVDHRATALAQRDRAGAAAGTGGAVLGDPALSR